MRENCVCRRMKNDTALKWRWMQWRLSLQKWELMRTHAASSTHILHRRFAEKCERTFFYYGYLVAKSGTLGSFWRSFLVMKNYSSWSETAQKCICSFSVLLLCYLGPVWCTRISRFFCFCFRSPVQIGPLSFYEISRFLVGHFRKFQEQPHFLPHIRWCPLIILVTR